MNVIQQTAVFASWLSGLADVTGKARIVARIEAAKIGNFGDCQPIGNGIFEMRIHHGPGYRVYYVRQDAVLYILLCGGDKSRQQADISRAKKMAAVLRAAASAEAGGAAARVESNTKPKAKAQGKKG